MQVCSWDDQQTKEGIFHQAMFDYQMASMITQL
jgi:hypothetical protein